MYSLSELISRLDFVTDRLALHVEYQKHTSESENRLDRMILSFAESVLSESHDDKSLDAILHVKTILSDATDRLELHTKLHAYDDDSENESDGAAIVDAREYLKLIDSERE